MNVAPPSTGYKMLLKIVVIVACGVAGYFGYPYLELSHPLDQASVEVEPLAEVVVKEIEIKSEELEKIEQSAEPGVSSVAIVLNVEKPFPMLKLVGTQASATSEKARDLELLKQAVESGEWENYREILFQSIEAELPEISLGENTQRYNAIWKEAPYYKAVLRWNVLGEFSESVLSTTQSTPNRAAFVSWLMVNDSAMEELLLTISKHDDKSAVFRFLSGVWEKYEDTPNLAAKYFNLALACAVVFDKKLPYKNSDTFNTDVDGLSRFLWYVEKNEGGLTEVNIDRSSARDLTFVVCSPVSEEELEWALKKFRSLSRKSFGNTYQEIDYLMERAVEGLNPYEEYTLPEILKEGGICGDQSYFCVNSARAAGIPALTLAGETNLGGHAWAAVKTKKDAWSTKIGRIGGVSIGVGNDPQSGEKINEQAIWLWSTREHQSRENVVKVNRLLWLSDAINNAELNDEKYGMIKVAHLIGKQFPAVWKRMYKLKLSDDDYTKDPSGLQTVKLWSAFVKELKYEFKKNPRMATLAQEIEDKHIFPYADLNDVRRGMARDRRRTDRDSKEQADLVTASLRRESKLLLARDKDKAILEIGQLYDRALRDFGGSVSGFRTMAKDYFEMMKGEPKSAKKAVGDIENAYKRVVETGTKAWFRAKAEIGLHRVICEMYREIGEEKRAANMEARLDRMMKRAKRGAL